MPVHESDICVIGGGITAVMLIERLAELKPNLKITAVEAGRSIFDRENRGTYHRRALDYGEHPWHDDYIEDQQAKGMISMTMAVGGQALHWGGACNRFSEEDLRLRSIYGLAGLADLTDRLEKFYVPGGVSQHCGRSDSKITARSASQAAIPLRPNLPVVTVANAGGLIFAAAGMRRQCALTARRCSLYDTCGDVCPTARPFARLHLSTADAAKKMSRSMLGASWYSPTRDVKKRRTATTRTGPRMTGIRRTVRAAQ
jgi:choline dehydrogenase-like flavoprotein